MNIETFAQKYNVPIFRSDSPFPQYFATHTIRNEDVLREKYLLCADLLTTKHLICEIDKYLGETKYVFFALGKGYLKTKDTIGLLYDPFELAKIEGANIVKNDLLYEIDKTSLLHQFCSENMSVMIELINKNSATIYKNIKKNTEKDLTCCSEKYLVDNFQQGIRNNLSLLVCDFNDFDHLVLTLIFDYILSRLPVTLIKELKDLLKPIKLKIIYSGFDKTIRDIFLEDKELLSSFSDEITEERMPEIRIPNKHKIDHGLIGVYQSS